MLFAEVVARGFERHYGLTVVEKSAKAQSLSHIAVDAEVRVSAIAKRALSSFG